MNLKNSGLLLAGLCMASPAVAYPESLDTAIPDFNRDIRPILSDHCFSCHGPDASHRKAGLRLDLEASAKSEKNGYPIISEGRPDASELIRRIVSKDPETIMPPAEAGKPLSADQIGLLRAWIESGASWSEHWAYQPPKWTKPPVAMIDSEKIGNWIDAFIQSKLKEKGLTPAEPADDVTLIRRLFLDLTGLPPAPDQVTDFLDDPSPDRFERLVDTLLSSEQFGERMAMVWLDLVRYADTVGYHGDQDHSISPYRDYVIDAFNHNKPFDVFTWEQLAGDLLPSSGEEGLIASGYNRLLQTSHEGGVQPKEYLAIYSADRVRNLSAVWFAATIGCAQCHDHKYDPYSSKDFYALSAFFADIDEEGHFTQGTNELPTNRPPERMVLSKKDGSVLESLQADLKFLRQDLDRRLDHSGENDGAIRDLKDRIREVERLIESISVSRRKTMITSALEKPRTTRILPRGNWLDDGGEIVEPGVPVFLGSLPSPDGRPDRLDLARWLTDTRNGIGYLTARVMVNRLWFLFFGTGLAPNLDDFGGQGQAPTHPELLDNLSIVFADGGWDIKSMVRLMLGGYTYRQSSRTNEMQRTQDRENRFFSRQSRQRMPAEMIRDTLLKVSGLLNLEVGGSSVKPYQPEGYYRHLNFPIRSYQHTKDFGQYRRGVYVHWQRQFLHPMFKAFDAPNREECTAKRPVSNTPLASLALLNDPSSIEAARVFAHRILKERPDQPWQDQLDWAWQWALSRKPDPIETAVMEELFADGLARAEGDPQSRHELWSNGLWPAPPESMQVSVAAWTSVTRALLNLNETITRN